MTERDVRTDKDRFNRRLQNVFVAVASIVAIAWLLALAHVIDHPGSYSGEFVVTDKREGGKTGTRLLTCHHDGSNCRWIDVNAATYAVYPVGSTVEIEEGTVLLPDHVRP